MQTLRWSHNLVARPAGGKGLSYEEATPWRGDLVISLEVIKNAVVLVPRLNERPVPTVWKRGFIESRD